MDRINSPTEKTMHVVIFEVEPQNNKKATYLNIAQQLLVDLEKIEGFISVERFESLTNPGKLLSLSTWQDEASIARWRNQVSHKKAQEAGRLELFSQYRIRVAHVFRDYDFNHSPWQHEK